MGLFLGFSVLGLIRPKSRRQGLICRLWKRILSEFHSNLLQNSVPWGFRPEAPVFCWLSLGGCCPSWKLPTVSGHVAASQQGTSFLQGRQETLSSGALAKTESNYVVYSRGWPSHQAKVDTLKEIINKIMNLFWSVVKMIFGLQILFNKRPEDTQLCNITTSCLLSSTSKGD